MKCSGQVKKKLVAVLSLVTLIVLIFSYRFSLKSLAKGQLISETSPILTDGGDQLKTNVQVPSSILPPLKILLTPAGLPKIIHFIYRDTNVIEPYREALRSCVLKNPDWQVVLWTDSAIKAFLEKHFASKVKVFAGFPYKIQRSDAIRYLILYKFGGLYMDLDMICHASLLPSLADLSCFLDSERRHQTQLVHNKAYSAMNSGMGCTPGHPFFMKVIEFVFHPDRLKPPFRFPSTIFITTGPMMLTSQFEQFSRTKSKQSVVVLNETYFSPKINPRSGIYGRCRSVASRLRNRKGAFSSSERICLELQRLGFENSDKLFITNRTVAIHQFTHLGYHNQKVRTFDVRKEFPRVISYEQLESGLVS